MNSDKGPARVSLPSGYLHIFWSNVMLHQGLWPSSIHKWPQKLWILVLPVLFVGILGNIPVPLSFLCKEQEDSGVQHSIYGMDIEEADENSDSRVWHYTNLPLFYKKMHQEKSHAWFGFSSHSDSHLVYPKLRGPIIQGVWIFLEYLGQRYSIIFSSSFTWGFVVSPETEHPQQPVWESDSIRPAAQQMDPFHPKCTGITNSTAGVSLAGRSQINKSLFGLSILICSKLLCIIRP